MTPCKSNSKEVLNVSTKGYRLRYKLEVEITYLLTEEKVKNIFLSLTFCSQTPIMSKLGTIVHYATPRFNFLFSHSYERNMQQQIEELNEKLKLKEKNSHVSGFLGI